MSEKLRYNPDIRGAGKYWLGLAAYVIAVDTYNGETLTNCFARGREHDNPLIKAATIARLGITALHLMDWLPEKYDPIDKVADTIGRWAVKNVHLP